MVTLKKELIQYKMKSSRRVFLASLFFLGIFNIAKAKKICRLTPSQPAGPFFKKDNVYQFSDLTNNGKAKGRIISIKGRIENKDCIPYPYSRMIVWQANAYGKYNHENDLSKNKIDPNFNGYMKLQSDKNGLYNFTTIIPGAYKISKTIKRPPHIHIFIQTRTNKKVITQLYFKDHPLNKKDFLFNRDEKNSLLELNVKRSSDSLEYANYNFII